VWRVVTERRCAHGRPSRDSVPQRKVEVKGRKVPACSGEKGWSRRRESNGGRGLKTNNLFIFSGPITSQFRQYSRCGHVLVTIRMRIL
jgi:hypothetical protein